jgi:hypothetical protein
MHSETLNIYDFVMIVFRRIEKNQIYFFVFLLVLERIFLALSFVHSKAYTQSHRPILRPCSCILVALMTHISM